MESRQVIVKNAPISLRYWKIGDICTIINGYIRLGGCWFNYDDRYEVDEINDKFNI